jgi:hypothetical protein
MSGTRRKPGRVGPFVEGYRVWLLEAGYTPQTVRGMLKVLGQLGRWMDSEGVEVGRLDAAGVESFLAARRAGGDRRVPTFRALRALVTYLRAAGVMLPENDSSELTPVERLVGEYRRWLHRRSASDDSSIEGRGPTKPRRRADLPNQPLEHYRAGRRQASRLTLPPLPHVAQSASPAPRAPRAGR